MTRFNLPIATARASAALLAAVLALSMLASTLYFEWFLGEVPCEMGGLEQLCAVFATCVLVAIAILGNTQRLLGLLLLISLTGFWLSARHWALHAAGDIGQGFGNPILGIHGYAWHALLFVALLLWVALTLTFSPKCRPSKDVPNDTVSAAKRFTRKALLTIASAALALKALSFFLANGPLPYAGQSVGEHFTRALGTERWSLTFWQHHWQAPRLFSPSSRLKEPDLARPTEAATHEALVTKATPLRPERLRAAPSPFEAQNDPIRCIAWDEQKRRFALVSSAAHIALTDATLHRITARASIDRGNGLTLSETAGCTWLTDRVITATSNKTLWAVTPDFRPLELTARNPGFSETTGNLRLVWGKNRAAVRTARAREAAISAFSADTQGAELFMISAPNEAVPHNILISIDARDLMPTQERPLSTDTLERLALTVKSATYWQQRLWLLSNEHLLLEVNTERAKVERAFKIEGLENILGLTAQSDALLVLTAAEGIMTLWRIAPPAPAPLTASSLGGVHP